MLTFVHAMKTLFNSCCLLLVVLSAGCTSTFYRSGDYSDDLYTPHDQIAIAKRKQAEAELQRAQAEARKAQWEARLAEAQASAAENSYRDATAQANPYTAVLADTYESAYARRLAGFTSLTYRMPSSYFELRYSGAYNYVSAYDPAFYNVMVSGDQVWVEPRYITSMFGTWGAAPVYGWYLGWSTPSYAWWGYPRYSWWDWNWNICYNPWYDPWWGPSGWWYAGYYPYRHPAGGWHPAPPRPGYGGGASRPGTHYSHNIVSRPSPYTSPTSGRQYGTGSASRFTNGSDRFQNTTTTRPSAPGNRGGTVGTGGNSGSRNPQTPASNSGNRYNNSNNNDRGSNSYNRGSNTNRSNNSYNSNNSGSFSRGGSSYGGNSGSYGGSSGGGGGAAGRNAGGR